MKHLAIPMNTIEAYSAIHIILVAVIIIAALIFAILLNHIKANPTVVVLVSAVILIAFEVMKQFLLTYVRGGLYSWSDFPFQLCSTPMYLCVVYLFVKTARQTIEDFLMVFGTIGALAAFAIPYSSFYNYLLLTAQSLLWHGILMFFGFYFFLKNKKLPARSYKKVGLTYLGLALIAVIINCCFYRISRGDANMFFFGPGYPQITVLDYIYEKAGWIVETIIMAIATTLAGFLLFKLLTYRGESTN